MLNINFYFCSFSFFQILFSFFFSCFSFLSLEFCFYRNFQIISKNLRNFSNLLSWQKLLVCVQKLASRILANEIYPVIKWRQGDLKISTNQNQLCVLLCSKVFNFMILEFFEFYRFLKFFNHNPSFTLKEISIVCIWCVY